MATVVTDRIAISRTLLRSWVWAVREETEEETIIHIAEEMAVIIQEAVVTAGMTEIHQENFLGEAVGQEGILDQEEKVTRLEGVVTAVAQQAAVEGEIRRLQDLRSPVGVWIFMAKGQAEQAPEPEAPEERMVHQRLLIVLQVIQAEHTVAVEPDKGTIV
jgi:hypothetical protein